MKAAIKQIFQPLELTIRFETLEELQAFEVIFYASAIVESEFISKRFNSDAITNALPRSHTDEQFTQFIKDLEAYF